jgi:hypothetical protein
MEDIKQSNSKKEREALNKVLEELEGLDTESQLKVLNLTVSFLGLEANIFTKTTQFASNENDGNKLKTPSNNASPKEFLRTKQPLTGMQRMACLAYYLIHYRNQQFFKTIDLSQLNTEAAQPKFANPSKTAGNAMTAGYFVSGDKKGTKQLSVKGEDFVNALPDQMEAKAIMANTKKQG